MQQDSIRRISALQGFVGVGKKGFVGGGKKGSVGVGKRNRIFSWICSLLYSAGRFSLARIDSHEPSSLSSSRTAWGLSLCEETLAM